MKSYPSIPTDYLPDIEFHLFDKLDGSNIRAEWNRKQGFTRFGTRRRLLTAGDPLAPARDCILGKYADDLGRIFQERKYQKVTCFFEYAGPSSFAGDHFAPPCEMDAILFDVNPLRRGFLAPEEFLARFDGLHLPRYLGCRRLDPGFVVTVRAGRCAGVTFEGIVGKAVHKNRLVMTKVKSRAWLERLRLETSGEAEFLRRA